MQLQYLDDDFQPGEYDVICGRGKKCYAHEGNNKFRNLCAERREVYTSAKTKDEKSIIVGVIISIVRERSPKGGFVKQDKDGKWYEVGDFMAREKTSQAFREVLHSNYKSSTVSRREKRQLRRAHKNSTIVDNSRSDGAPRADDRRHSNPVLARGLAEAIRLARREMGDDDDDEHNAEDLNEKRPAALPRRSSDPQLSHLSTFSKCVSPPLKTGNSPTTLDFIPPKKRLPFSEPRTQCIAGVSQKKKFSFAVPHAITSSSVGGAKENSSQKATSQKPVTLLKSSLPNIPISTLLKDGKPIRVNQEDLKKACEMYAAQIQPIKSPGCWGLCKFQQ